MIPMAGIKITNIKAIDDLQAKLILRTGRKISQQETLDICIEVANANFEEILRIASSIPILTPEIADTIIETFEKFKDAPYDVAAKFASDTDNDAYSL
jgi:hypothetical protein